MEELAQSRRGQQGSIVLLWGLLGLMFLQASETKPSPWEERESLLIFESAKKLEGEGQLEGAVKEYSEILEFFPGTQPWKKACIKLSDLYLKTRREDQSRLVLERLKLSIEKNQEELGEDILLAYLQNFVNRKAYDELVNWLKMRSEKEQSLIRSSKDLTPLWAKIQERSGLKPKALVDAWLLLGHQNPGKALLDLGREKGLIFSQELLVYLHGWSLEEGDLDSIRSVTQRMVRDGWGKVAHGLFKQKSQGEVPWKVVWLHSMIAGRLHEEALEVLDTMEDSQDRDVERMGVLIGLERYEEGFHLLMANASWMESALTLEQFESLLEGVNSLPQGRLYQEQFFQALKEGGRKDLLKARWVLKGKERESLLRKIATEDSFFGPYAAGDLGRTLAEEGRLEELKKWTAEVEERFPRSEVLEQMKQRLEILSGLKGEGPETVLEP